MNGRYELHVSDLQATTTLWCANMDDGSCLVIGDTCDDMDDMTINDMVNDSCVCAGDLVIEVCTDCGVLLKTTT